MRSRIASFCAVALAAAVLPTACSADSRGFGLTELLDRFVVNTGAGLVFAVPRSNGDLISIQYGSRECEAPFAEAQRYSHYESGLSHSSIITAEKDPGGQWIKITIVDDKIGVTHYYIAHRGENNPPTACHPGANTIDLQIVGSTKSYPGFLSPNVVFDAIDLVTTADARKAAASFQR